ncbi:MAG TPA: TolC family protein, partial [Polyangiaceae bacterium]|nr:TolC family protein [Polyangiaceae bacterium]
MSFASAAAGQPAPAAQPAPAPAAPPAPAAAAPTTPAEPKLPTVEDPMLQPPPPPRRTLRNWQEALQLVRQNSTSLRTQAARVFQAEARARQALSLALPQLVGTANLTHQILKGETEDRTVAGVTIQGGDVIPDPATTWNAGLGLRVPVFAPQAWYDHGTAKREIQLAKLDTKELERQALGAVANAIVSVVTAERLSEVSRVSLQSSLSTVDLTKRRAALGASSQLDVLRVEQEVQLARAQLVAADESVMRAREALGLALGSSDNFGVPPDIKLDQLASDAKTSCRRDSNITNRPDLRASQYNIELAERRKKGVDWSFWPTVDAVSNLTYWSN